MWDSLFRVDWGRLRHAYGRAHSVPLTLHKMVSVDEKTRELGWLEFWAAVNHQGDFYDSTVAAIPFLVEAVRQPEVPGRASILNYFRERSLDAPTYGGDPVLAEPPGGVDEPTPMLTDAELAAIAYQPPDEPGDEIDEDYEGEPYRRMDLCAWQTGRAILAGRPTFRTAAARPRSSGLSGSGRAVAALARNTRCREAGVDPVDRG